MNILIAPDKFKGTLTAMEVCDAIEHGLQLAGIKDPIRKLPLADGGDGTSDVLLWHLKGSHIDVPVHDPLMRLISSSYGLSNDGKTAVIEMAKASGLNLLKKEEYNPLRTTSYGTGELILDALNRNARKIIIGIGGSATNDAGLGVIGALGALLKDRHGELLSPTGENLKRIDKIDLTGLSDKIKNTEFIAICDVSNPLHGPNGAAHIYAPQKGATPDDVQVLDAGLIHLAERIRQQLGIDVQSLNGAGAGGGMGAGMHAFLNATLMPGTDLIFSIAGLSDHMEWADVIITGEGKLDAQTSEGKLIQGIAKMAAEKKKQVLVVCGKSELAQATWERMHIHAVHSLTEFAGADAAINDAQGSLEALADQVLGREIKKG